jgi:hypothetical protein
MWHWLWSDWWHWVLAWFVLSIPVGVLAGKYIKWKREIDEIMERVRKREKKIEKAHQN